MALELVEESLYVAACELDKFRHTLSTETYDSIKGNIEHVWNRYQLKKGEVNGVVINHNASDDCDN